MNSSEENLVVNLGTLSTLVAAFTHTCEQQNPRVKIEKRQGLCIAASTECTTTEICVRSKCSPIYMNKAINILIAPCNF